MSHKFTLPRLYPILDAAALQRTGIPLTTAGRALYEAGIRWVQYRDKKGSDAEVVERMRALRAIFPGGNAVLLLNDRVHLCGETRADGVHIGQDDVTSMKARRMLGPSKLLGVSTHNTAQLRVAAAVGAADYLAIGPVYATASKENPDPVVGLEGVRAARALTALPLVAIGGITGEKAREVLDAGADSVAVISALLPRAGSLPELDMKQTVSKLLSYMRNSQAD